MKYSQSKRLSVFIGVCMCCVCMGCAHSCVVCVVSAYELVAKCIGLVLAQPVQTTRALCEITS